MAAVVDEVGKSEDKSVDDGNIEDIDDVEVEGGASEASKKKKRKKKKKKAGAGEDSADVPGGGENEKKVDEIKDKINDIKLNGEEEEGGTEEGGEGKKKKRKRKGKGTGAKGKTQTDPPSIPIAELISDGVFPVGQEMEYPLVNDDRTAKDRFTSEEKRALDRLHNDIYLHATSTNTITYTILQSRNKNGNLPNCSGDKHLLFLLGILSSHEHHGRSFSTCTHTNKRQKFFQFFTNMGQ